ncbi:MAG: hypothetical protein ABL880_07960 [Methylotenera sp.]
MNTLKLTSLSLALFFCCSGTSKAEEISCPAPEQLSNKMTPVELYGILPVCINKADYKTAVLIFGLAGVYGKYDTMRVADITSHQAIGFLKRMALDSSQATQKAAFQKEAGETFDNKERHAALCESIIKTGVPTYFPSYMIQHGLNAVNGTEISGNGLVSPFDSKAAWEQSVTGYMHCD